MQGVLHSSFDSLRSFCSHLFLSGIQRAIQQVRNKVTIGGVVEKHADLEV